MSEDVQPIGQVTHYFDRISVAAIMLWEPLTVGKWIHFYGDQTNFVQPVQSMEMNHEQIEEAFPEEEIAVKVEAKVQVGDYIYPYEPVE